MRQRTGPPDLELESMPVEEMLRGEDPIRAWDTSALLDRQDWSALIPPLFAAGADPTETIDRLKRFSIMLLSWNRSYSNLISRNDEGRFVARHLLESLLPAPALKSTGVERWLDFGSGGGLPAVPLLLAGVGKHWTLVESRRTKTLFLRRAAQELGISDLDVVNARLETMIEEDPTIRRFDGFTSRATLPLTPTLALAANLVVEGGWAFLWKGSRHGEELRADQDWRRSWSLEGRSELSSGPVVVLRFRRV